MSYGYKKQVSLPFNEAVEKTRQALAREGFGVLTEIDVKATMKKKLNADFEDYLIMGACNPPLAYQVLQVIKDAGLMMPCNVIVFTENGRTFVEAAMPSVLVTLLQNDQLRSTAEKAEAGLKRAIDSIG